MKKLISLFLCLVMLVSVAAVVSAETVQAPELVWDENEETILLTDGAEYGEGAKTFTFELDYQLRHVSVTIHTDAETVGEALSALNIIYGEDGQWGMMVTTINGVTADYNVDQSYWAFYIDGEYAMTGVDSTEITEGSVYTFAVEGGEELDTVILVDGETLGRGETSFTFQVVDGEGNETAITVNTDAATVGEALSALHIIAGEDSQWGLMVTIVNGITADYNVDGHYWAFYIDGEYAMTGVDSTDVTDGAVYTFKVE